MIISTFGYFTDRSTGQVCPLSLHAKLFLAQYCIASLDLIMSPGVFIPEAVTKRGYSWKAHKNGMSSRVALRIYEDFCRGHDVHLLARAKNEGSLIQLQQVSGLKSSIQFKPLLPFFKKDEEESKEMLIYKEMGIMLTTNAKIDIDTLSKAFTSKGSPKIKGS
jgi:hypothetical protein